MPVPAPVELVDEDEMTDLAAGFHRRGTAEFDRFCGFSDGVFGFAMTLLISTVAVPVIESGGLGEALKDQIPDVLSYFISFAVIGYYWMAHHRLFAAMGAVTSKLMRLNLVYLALIAFMPFPTALFGRYTDAPLSVVLYATALSFASLIEVLMLREARHDRTLRVPLPDDAYRFVLVAALVPVMVFGLSILVAVVAGGAAAYVWLLIVPVEWALGRRSPEASRLFG